MWTIRCLKMLLVLKQKRCCCQTDKMQTDGGGVPDLGARRFPVCVAEAVRVAEPVLAADLVYGSAAEWCWRRWRPIGERREASDRWVRRGRREEAGG
jgi:hypothetical protein